MLLLVFRIKHYDIALLPQYGGPYHTSLYNLVGMQHFPSNLKPKATNPFPLELLHPDVDVLIGNEKERKCGLRSVHAFV